MINLNYIQYNPDILIKYIYNKDKKTPTKGKELLASKHSFIEDRIKTYLEKLAINRLEEVQKHTFTDDKLKAKLEGMYDSTAEPIKTLKEKVRDLTRTTCPYCGTQESPYHIDHYLPQSVFSEYSILSCNLIPACSSCNSRYKGDQYKSESGVRQFYNPYTDSFVDDIQFLECKISVHKKYLVVTYDINEVIRDSYPYEYSIIKNHFGNLNLGSRYKDLIVDDVFVEFYNEYVDYDEELQKDSFVDTTFDEIRRDIDKKIRGFRNYNKNYWKKVFFTALKESDEALRLIINKEIPLN